MQSQIYPHRNEKKYKMSFSSVFATRRASLPVCIREALLMFTQSRKKKYFFWQESTSTVEENDREPSHSLLLSLYI